MSGTGFTDEYKISDLDSSGATQYFGFTDKDGNWFILELTSSTARYIKGTTGYITNWTGRVGLLYDYPYTIF